MRTDQTLPSSNQMMRTSMKTAWYEPGRPQPAKPQKSSLDSHYNLPSHYWQFGKCILFRLRLVLVINQSTKDLFECLWNSTHSRPSLHHTRSVTFWLHIWIATCDILLLCFTVLCKYVWKYTPLCCDALYKDWCFSIERLNASLFWIKVVSLTKTFKKIIIIKYEIIFCLKKMELFLYIGSPRQWKLLSFVPNKTFIHVTNTNVDILNEI